MQVKRIDTVVGVAMQWGYRQNPPRATKPRSKLITFILLWISWYRQTDQQFTMYFMYCTVHCASQKVMVYIIKFIINTLNASSGAYTEEERSNGRGVYRYIILWSNPDVEMVIELIPQWVLKFYTSPKTFIAPQNKFLATPLLILPHFIPPVLRTHKMTVYNIRSFCVGILNKYTHYIESLSELLNATRNLTL